MDTWHLNNKFSFIEQITFKDRICVSGKYDIKFPISTFVADKNEFSNKFAGVATAKEFVSKFNASRTDAGPSTHCARPATVDVSGDAEMSEEDDSLLRANGSTPIKRVRHDSSSRLSDYRSLSSEENVSQSPNVSIIRRPPVISLAEEELLRLKPLNLLELFVPFHQQHLFIMSIQAQVALKVNLIASLLS